MQLLLRGDAICPDDGVQISRVLVIQSWGCAGTLGLGAGNSNISGDGNSSNKNNAPSSGGGVGGMIHAASSSVSSTLGGITGIVLGGGHSGTAIIADGSSINSHSHYLSSRSVKEDTSIALKILQTITMLIDSRSVILSQDVLGACLSVCLLLGAGQTYSDGNSGSGAASSAVGSIRDRFRAETVNAQQHHHHVAAKDHDTTGGGTAGNVKRAALATMNQILSILFDRAKDVMMSSIQQVASSDEESTIDSSILALAERTMTDLCTLVNKSSSTGASTTPSKSTSSSSSKLYGPFATASKEGLSPSSTTSLSLVDMIMKQICNDLFNVCFDFLNNDDSEQQQQVTTTTTTNPGIKFAIQIIIQSFQLGQSLLGSQYCYHVTKLSLEFSLKSSFKDIPSIPSSSSFGSSNLVDFCLYYYTTSLVTTLLTHYLSSTNVACYERLDAYVVENCVESSSEISKMALDMVKQLVSFVSEATEAYHKTDDFEVSVSERLRLIYQLYIFYLNSQLLIFFSIVGWLYFYTNREGII